MKRSSLLLAALGLSGVAAAQQGPPPPPAPAGNPITSEKALLGKALFWDEQLSATRTVACATCHIPELGGSDPRTTGAPGSVHPGPDGALGTADDVFGSPGVPLTRADGSYQPSGLFGMAAQVTGRKAPTVINAAFSPNVQFWDGRSDGTFEDPVTGQLLLNGNAALESQAAVPPTSTAEMSHLGADWPGVVARLEASEPLALATGLPVELANFVAGRTYPELFGAAFGTPEVTPARVAMAIATYERTLIGASAPFDAFVGGPGGPGGPGGDPNALTQQERRGHDIFFGPGRCATCHGGPAFTDNQFHYTGVRPVAEDLGRFEVTGVPGARGRMKTPGLRNVELRGPFFHNGRFQTLGEVVAFYNRGGDFNAPNKAPQITPLGLSPQQQADLVAFLRRPLTDPRVPAGLPPFDGLTLYSQSSRAPDQYGAGTAGTGGHVPVLTAIEPPLVGNPSLSVAVENGFGGKPGVFVLSPLQDLAGTPFAGTDLHIGLGPGLQILRIGALEGVGPGGGFGTCSISVPADPALVGTSLFGQFLVVDNGGPGRFAATPGVRFDWF
jgi:cytochrome c peroxidase